MRIEIPELCVVALVGISSSGKSTFAKKHFKATEVLSSDYFRALVSDDENNQNVTPQAFDALYSAKTCGSMGVSPSFSDDLFSKSLSDLRPGRNPSSCR